MPELPEVEFAARNLRRWTRGKTIVDAIVPRTRVLRAQSAPRVAAALRGRRVVRVDRRGKWLRLVLDDDTRVFSHLGLTGRWVRRGRDAKDERSERLRIDLETQSLRYIDPRMFGRFVIARDDIDEWRALGPDPLVDGLDGARLADLLAGQRRPIKLVLMDQQVLAGIGNIQATDALFGARIDPRTRADRLTRADIGRLARAILKSIDRTLALETGPEITYVEDANAPNPFVIYGRAGAPCPRCRTPLTRLVLGGRTTVLCTRCQGAR